MTDHNRSSVITFLTLDEVAEALRVSVVTVRRMIKRGELAVTRGPRLLVSRTEVDRWIRARSGR